MSDPFIGEIKIFGGNFAPMDWATCDGQTMSIAQHDALYSLIGTTYGGDGTTNFKLPDLRGRIPIHMGTAPGMTPRYIGQPIGTEQETLNLNTMPAHSHSLAGSLNAAHSNDPNGRVLGTCTGEAKIYTSSTGAQVTMNQNSVTSAGSESAHNNMMPALCLNFIIALNGIYPSRS